jgi:septal ring factor EnvC (AmiA/AmiB activator)
MGDFSMSILMAFAMALLSPTVFAQNSPADMSRLSANIEYQRLLLDEVSILEAMEKLDDNIRRRADDLEKLQVERQTIAVSLMELEVRFEDATKELRDTRDRIRQRIGAYTRYQRESKGDSIRLLWNPQVFFQSYAPGSRRKRLIKTLLSKDRELITHYKNNLEQYEIERADLSSKRSSLESLESDIASNKSSLSQHRKDRKEVLRLIEEEKAYYDKAYQDLKQAHNDMAIRIRKLKGWQDKKLNFRSLKGSLRLPMSYADVVTPFGLRQNTRLRTQTLHPGLEIKSGGSESVRAIQWGRVAYLGSISGYGTTIILDHTEGYHSLYARLNRVLVKEGDIVETREVLGTIGGACALGTPDTLYFELRETGMAIDPTTWFAQIPR